MHRFGQKDKNTQTSHNLRLTRALKTAAWQSFQMTKKVPQRLYKFWCGPQPHWNPEILLLWSMRSSQVKKAPFKIVSMVKDLFSSGCLFLCMYSASDNLLKPLLASPNTALAKSLPGRRVCVSMLFRAILLYIYTSAPSSQAIIRSSIFR